MGTFWFIVIAVLWTGFMVLEGFDFGVGSPRSPAGTPPGSRRCTWPWCFCWSGLSCAGSHSSSETSATARGGAEAGTPRCFSAASSPRCWSEWRCPASCTVCRSTANHEFVGDFWDLLSAYSVLGGLTFVLMCLLHGATFLAIKTTDEIRARAIRVARMVAPITAAAVTAYVIWTHVVSGKGFLLTNLELAAILAVLSAVWLVRIDRDGWAFTATAVTMAAVVLNIFADLYPNVLVSTMDSAYNLTIDNAASGPYALKVMTVVIVVLLPGILVYQGWSYHVFRKRVTRGQVSAGSH